jgi:hypothetical protein
LRKERFWKDVTEDGKVEAYRWVRRVRFRSRRLRMERFRRFWFRTEGVQELEAEDG